MSRAADGMAKAMLAVIEDFAPLREAVAGYRADLEAKGFSPTAAEAMTVDLHRLLMDQCRAAVMPPAPPT